MFIYYPSSQTGTNLLSFHLNYKFFREKVKLSLLGFLLYYSTSQLWTPGEIHTAEMARAWPLWNHCGEVGYGEESNSQSNSSPHVVSRPLGPFQVVCQVKTMFVILLISYFHFSLFLLWVYRRIFLRLYDIVTCDMYGLNAEAGMRFQLSYIKPDSKEILQRCKTMPLFSVNCY